MAEMQESQQRSSPTSFLTKTYRLVDDPANREFVSWNEAGTGFIVKHSIDFARDVLPRYFKHDNFSSFVRQLNSYGFKKVSTDHFEFSHMFFKRGEQQLLSEIRRRPRVSAATHVNATPISAVPATESNSGEGQVISSTSSPMATAEAYALKSDAEIIAENQRLRRQNEAMRQELEQIRSYCNIVTNTMSNVATGGWVSGCPVGSRECTVGSGVAADESGPRLFGVPIGRRACVGEPAEEARGCDADDM